MISILPRSGVISRVHFAPGGYIPNQGQAHEAQFRVVTPDYFRTMGILIEGRDFAERDSKDSEPVVIINRELASKYWTDRGALGARLTFENFGGPGQQTARVIGIVSNIKQSTLDEATTTDIYIPLRQIGETAVPWLSGTHFWVARTSVAPAVLRDGLRQALARTDKGAGASEIEGFDWYLRSALSVRRFNLALIAAFGVTSLLLAITGIYAVVSYSLVLRRREIATRIALGASPGQIVQMVLAQGTRLVISGLAVGIFAVLAATRFIRTMLFGVAATDPSAFSMATIVVFVAALFLAQFQQLGPAGRTR
jgi:ABC-type lipoprotein release transport system permease subunit